MSQVNGFIFCWCSSLTIAFQRLCREEPASTTRGVMHAADGNLQACHWLKIKKKWMHCSSHTTYKKAYRGCKLDQLLSRGIWFLVSFTDKHHTKTTEQVFFSRGLLTEVPSAERTCILNIYFNSLQGQLWCAWWLRNSPNNILDGWEYKAIWLLIKRIVFKYSF